MQAPIGKWPLRAVLAGIFVLLLFCLFTIGRSWVEGQVSALGLCLLLLLFAGAIIFTLMQQEVIPWGQKPIPHWLQPKVLGSIAAAIILAMGAVFSALPLLEKKGGVEAALSEVNQRLGRIETKVDDVGDTTKAIERDTEEIKDRLGIGEQSLIRRNVVGLWGEPGCGVTYRFELRQNALLIASQDRAPGVDAMDWEYTVDEGRDIAAAGLRRSVFEGREIKGFHPNQSYEFLLEDNGSTQTMLWRNLGEDQNPLKLGRCDR